MEILNGVQPNCSELVVRLGDVDKVYVREELAKLGINEYIIRNRYNYDEPKRKTQWDTDDNLPRMILTSDLPEEVLNAWEQAYSEDQVKEMAAKKILEDYGLDRQRDTMTLCDGTDQADFDPGIWVSNDPYDEGIALWYSQHCQSQGFPTLKRISDHFGVNVEAHDGGSIDSYEEWLENGEVSDES